jgi:hypothetical protein
VEFAGNREIVVSGEADHGPITRELDAGVGLGAVADEVAEAPDLIDGAARDVCRARLPARACLRECQR